MRDIPVYIAEEGPWNEDGALLPAYYIEVDDSLLSDWLLTAVSVYK